MNGFELKEKINLLKNRINETETDLKKNPLSYATKDDLLVGKVKRFDYLGKHQERLGMLRELASLERLQEKFNVETMSKYNGEQISLAEAIKLHGMYTKTVVILSSIQQNEDILPRYSANVTKDSVHVPYLQLTEENFLTLRAEKDRLEKMVSEMKALIATMNAQIVRE